MGHDGGKARRNGHSLPGARGEARLAVASRDLRFRTLLGETAWAALPAATRTRFGKRIADCRAIIFAGEIIECRMSRAGRLLAQAGAADRRRRCRCRATSTSRHWSASPRIRRCGGQFWTRIYGRRRGFPQVIHSSKRFCGPTGLEEYVGRGFGIALRTEVADGALHFVSDHYFLSALGRAAAPAALAGAGAAAGQPYRLHPWPLRLRARPSPRSVRRADPADGDVPRADRKRGVGR